MQKSDINTSQHIWIKQNLVTISKSGKMYDEMKCSLCGMKGKRYGFTHVEVLNKYKEENVHLCPKAKPIETPKKIKVIHCGAAGEVFSNLKPNSIHEVIPTPKEYLNSKLHDVWVMGVGYPVKLLSDEYEIINE